MARNPIKYTDLPSGAISESSIVAVGSREDDIVNKMSMGNLTYEGTHSISSMGIGSYFRSLSLTVTSNVSTLVPMNTDVGAGFSTYPLDSGKVSLLEPGLFFISGSIIIESVWIPSYVAFSLMPRLYIVIWTSGGAIETYLRSNSENIQAVGWTNFSLQISAVVEIGITRRVGLMYRYDCPSDPHTMEVRANSSFLSVVKVGASTV